MFHIGPPIGGEPSPGSSSSTEDQTVVSVGPYTFHSDAHRGRSSSASARGNASPPARILSVALPFHPASTSSCHVVAVACMNVAPELASQSARSTPSIVASRGMTTSRAPTISVR